MYKFPSRVKQSIFFGLTENTRYACTKYYQAEMDLKNKIIVVPTNITQTNIIYKYYQEYKVQVLIMNRGTAKVPNDPR